MPSPSAEAISAIDICPRMYSVFSARSARNPTVRPVCSIVCGSGGSGMAGISGMGAVRGADAIVGGAVCGWYTFPSLMRLLVLTEHSLEGRFVDHFDTELLRFFQLRSCAWSGDDEVRLRAHRSRYFRAERLRERLRFLTRSALERAREHQRLARERALGSRLARCGHDRVQVRRRERGEELLLFRSREEFVDAVRDDLADARDRLQLVR